MELQCYTARVHATGEWENTRTDSKSCLYSKPAVSRTRVRASPSNSRTSLCNRSAGEAVKHWIQTTSCRLLLTILAELKLATRQADMPKIARLLFPLVRFTLCKKKQREQTGSWMSIIIAGTMIFFMIFALCMVNSIKVPDRCSFYDCSR